MALFHLVWVQRGEDPGPAEATMEGLAFPIRLHHGRFRYPVYCRQQLLALTVSKTKS